GGTGGDGSTVGPGGYSARGRQRGSGRQERREVRGGQGRTPQSLENAVDGLQSDLTGCRDLDADRLSARTEIDHHARLDPFRRRGPFLALPRKIEVRRHRTAMSKRDFQI